DRRRRLTTNRSAGRIEGVQVSAKLDYAVRAMLELAAAAPDRRTRDQVAQSRGIPGKYLEAILGSLRQAGLVRSQRGPEGGYSLAADPGAVTVAEIARAVEGPLTLVQGMRPETVLDGPEPLAALWVAVRASLRTVLEAVTLADLLEGQLPAEVEALIADDDAWRPH
ncbi:MAG TPA: Rrf2 family transcriptional regulator, partial [Acidimicrobiales bacterium]